MYRKKKILAVIPARKGSIGLPGKNLIRLGRWPLIVWSIKTALACKVIDKIIVSTDSKKIARVACQTGAEVPFLRPAYLATGSASSIDVLMHCLKFLEKKNQKYDIILLIEPTSPLREVTDINRGIYKLITTKGAESVISVTRAVSSHPEYLYLMLRNGKVAPFLKNSKGHVRRQELSTLYYPEGTFYGSYTKTLKKTGSFYHKKTFGFEVPRWKSIEIDEKFDLLCAEAVLRQMKRKKND